MLKCRKRIREIGNKNLSLSGQFSSEKIKSIVQFESSLERDLIYLLEFNTDVKTYIEQPLLIYYEDEFGTEHTYTPDFLVEYYSKKRVLIEVKYSDELSRNKQLKYKFNAAEEFCKKNGFTFEVLTEKEIRKDKIYLQNIKFLSRYRHYFDSIDTFDSNIEIDMYNISRLLDILEHSNRITINELICKFTSTEQTIAEMIFWIWRLVSENFINCDLSIELTQNSVIWKD